MGLFGSYKSATNVVAGIMTTVFLYVMTIIVPMFLQKEDPLSRTLLFVMCLSGVYSLLFGVCMYVYERHFWKLVYPAVNFSGLWEVTVTYEFLERRAIHVEGELPLPHVFQSAFRIEQTATSISFPEGYSAPNEVWKDRTSRLTPDGIDMSYEVTRSDKTGADPLPPRTIGFENIRVTEYDYWRRPKTMAGTLAHVAIPGVNLYRGHTHYRRVSARAYRRRIKELCSQESDEQERAG